VCTHWPCNHPDVIQPTLILLWDSTTGASTPSQRPLTSNVRPASVAQCSAKPCGPGIAGEKLTNSCTA
jgi:hypothetical protein